MTVSNRSPNRELYNEERLHTAIHCGTLCIAQFTMILVCFKEMLTMILCRYITTSRKDSSASLIPRESPMSEEELPHCGLETKG